MFSALKNEVQLMSPKQTPKFHLNIPESKTPKIKSVEILKELPRPLSQDKNESKRKIEK